ncbi:MAG: class I SAM-dependent methyltransferase [Woeseiaceae bacterium]|jgi:2-polyprenyl-3-methyl-5-hydroxy-6-metoxy-1,4-benzoquinol methylase|nr:class I SAM-dependent methyltransferase [Woeseiaceae bacterium]
MKKIPRELLLHMASAVSAEDRDEMAIPSYLHSNPAMRWIAWRRLDVVARFLDDLSRRQALETCVDFGCGTGVLFEELSRHAERVYGIDIVREPAEILVDEWNLDKVSILSPEAAQTEIAPGSVDAIVAAEVLEHIEPLDDTLGLFGSLLRPTGRLLVSLPTENRLYRLGRRLAGFHGHYHESNAASIHQQILAAGFRQARTARVPLPGPLAIYWVTEYARA